MCEKASIRRVIQFLFEMLTFVKLKDRKTRRGFDSFLLCTYLEIPVTSILILISVCVCVKVIRCGSAHVPR